LIIKIISPGGAQPLPEKYLISIIDLYNASVFVSVQVDVKTITTDDTLAPTSCGKYKRNWITLIVWTYFQIISVIFQKQKTANNNRKVSGKIKVGPHNS